MASQAGLLGGQPGRITVRLPSPPAKMVLQKKGLLRKNHATIPPDLHTALAVSRDVFCAAFVFSDYDEEADDEFDQQTALLLYDGALPQPWDRIDIPRNARDICRYDDPVTGQAILVVLSSEGYVYYLWEGGVDHEHIPGAGLYSDDAAAKDETKENSNPEQGSSG